MKELMKQLTNLFRKTQKFKNNLIVPQDTSLVVCQV